ncbi:MAG: hypothetical protein CME06_02940 [Gemmatimonadetes bacterium]|nr:hypothetical protein [Gemmatimonadota bacterium]
MEDATVFDLALLWFVVGLALALAEMAAPGVILIFFGLGAWVVALTTWIGLTPGLQSQLLLFAVAPRLHLSWACAGRSRAVSTAM